MRTEIHGDMIAPELAHCLGERQTNEISVSLPVAVLGATSRRQASERRILAVGG